jgi:hypothetical protein
MDKAMNMFGSFRFGSIIKTFLPGLVWLGVIALALATIAELSGQPSTIIALVQNKTNTAIIAAIPLAILGGLLSNIVIFMGLSDKLVREPVRRKHSDLARLYDCVSHEIAKNAFPFQNNAQGPDLETFTDNVDPEVIALHKINAETVSYVREQY